MNTKLLLCLIALTAAVPVCAESLPYRFVANSVNWNVSEPLVFNPQDFVLTSSTTSIGYNGLTGNASVGGLANYGIAKAFATGDGDGYSGTSQAGWVDVLKIDAGARNGQAGMVTFAVNYTWDLTYNHAAPIELGGDVYMVLGSANASVFQSPYVNCNAGFGCATYFESTLETYADGGAVVTNTGVASPVGANGRFFAQMPIVFGADTLLQVSLIASVFYNQLGLYGLSVSSGSVYADHSLTWGGIIGITGSGGSIVDYTVASASGFNYVQPYTSSVPEIGSAWLACIGFLAIAGLRSCKFRKHASRPDAYE